MKVYTGKMGQKQRIRIGSKISDSLIYFKLGDEKENKFYMFDIAISLIIRYCLFA